MRRVDAHEDGDRWAGDVPGHRDRPLAVHDRGVDRRRSRPGATSSPARSPAGQEDLQLRAARGRAAARGRRSSGSRTRATGGCVEHALEQLRDDDARRRRSKHAVALDSPARRGRSSGTPTARRRRRSTSRSSSSSTASARASAPGTSCSRARSAASTGVREQLPRLKELGFDVIYLPPIHPIGHRNRKGRNNALVAGPDDPGSPWAIGDETGGHNAIHPDLGTIEDFDALTAAARRARHGHRARLRDPVLRRPPVADRAPRVVQPPPRRDAEVRREPAQALPGHLQRQLGLARTGRACGRRCSTSSATGSTTASRSSASTTRTPSRSPFWEWLIREITRDRPGRALPRRGVHAPRAARRPGQGRLQPVLHVLHVEELALGPRAVHLRAAHAGAARDGAAEPLRQHAGHPPRVPPARRPVGVRHAARARGDAEPDVRHLLGLRALRERPGAAGQRGVPGLREVRGSRRASSTARCCRSSRRSTTSAARTPRSSTSRTSRSSTPRTTG